MKKQANIIIKTECFEKNYKTMKNIYNIAETLDCFCKFHDGIEEIMNIAPIIEYLKNESDKLYFDFSNIRQECETRNHD